MCDSESELLSVYSCREQNQSLLFKFHAHAVSVHLVKWNSIRPLYGGFCQWLLQFALEDVTSVHSHIIYIQHCTLM